MADWYLAGMRFSEMPAYIAEHADKWPGELPSQEQILDLLQSAVETIAADTVVDVDQENNKAIARLNILYARCLTIQDYKGAASIQREITRAVDRVANAAFLKSTNG